MKPWRCWQIFRTAMPESAENGSEPERRLAPSEPASGWQPHPHAGHTLVYHVAARLLRLFLRLYGHCTVEGVENVPRTGPLLLACNHVSYLDPIMVLAALYRYRFTRSVAKSELWRSRLVAWFLDQVGASPV
ncbi:MAG: 1-acyl-sn-glycerol-3-phosphate acyltransferase, partial [Armatimonadetes bacterium]|nr:1-acyl-sn-glycerol-3-phosphate acyltransferase [Armatimonadota bacterium]